MKNLTSLPIVLGAIPGVVGYALLRPCLECTTITTTVYHSSSNPTSFPRLDARHENGTHPTDDNSDIGTTPTSPEPASPSVSSTLPPLECGKRKQGQPEDCNRWYLVGPGDTFIKMEKLMILSRDEIVKWNAGFNKDGTNLPLGYEVCVGTRSNDDAWLRALERPYPYGAGRPTPNPFTGSPSGNNTADEPPKPVPALDPNAEIPTGNNPPNIDIGYVSGPDEDLPPCGGSTETPPPVSPSSLGSTTYTTLTVPPPLATQSPKVKLMTKTMYTEVMTTVVQTIEGPSTSPPSPTSTSSIDDPYGDEPWPTSYPSKNLTSTSTSESPTPPRPSMIDESPLPFSSITSVLPEPTPNPNDPYAAVDVVPLPGEDYQGPDPCPRVLGGFASPNCTASESASLSVRVQTHTNSGLSTSSENKHSVQTSTNPGSSITAETATPTPTSSSGCNSSKPALAMKEFADPRCKILEQVSKKGTLTPEACKEAGAWGVKVGDLLKGNGVVCDGEEELWSGYWLCVKLGGM
ncbi:hypothetical protein BJ508DRAFT_312284 [Ascobolus immersus RN42]|uniref:LysM domain-containing protein n=1 Tax=Ascobolus immersus RN42 TaxID=1160509 RepID=A0A3N4HRE9_ASCIM|nr:hypothetical protein BJ508DRAFT_312284 [Ascobolus immersus RN42]